MLAQIINEFEYHESIFMYVAEYEINVSFKNLENI